MKKKNELTSLNGMHSIHLKNGVWISLAQSMLSVLAVLAALRLPKVGDANGAELALLGGPAVLFQPLLPFSGGVLLGADDAAVLVHE